MSFFRGSKVATPTNTEEPLLGPVIGAVNGGSPARRVPFPRTGLRGSVLNLVKPLKHAEKRKERLFEGAFEGNLEKVKQALDDGADINAEWHWNNKTAMYHHTPLYTASRMGHVEVVRELLRRGAEVDTVVEDFDGNLYTALYVASQNGHLEVVRELLSNGAAINFMSNDHGMTPLRAAFGRGHLEVVRELLARGATSTPVITAWSQQQMATAAPASGGRRRRYTHTKRTRRTKRTKHNKKTRRH